MQLDIGNMLATLEKKQQSQKTKQDAKPVILTGWSGWLDRYHFELYFEE